WRARAGAWYIRLMGLLMACMVVSFGGWQWAWFDKTEVDIGALVEALDAAILVDLVRHRWLSRPEHHGRHLTEDLLQGRAVAEEGHRLRGRAVAGDGRDRGAHRTHPWVGRIGLQAGCVDAGAQADFFAKIALHIIE